MLHCRADYMAIQPYPTKRHHWLRDSTGHVMEAGSVQGKELERLVAAGRIKPIIPDDEPVFLIRAQDVVGPQTVRGWAHLAEAVGADSKLTRAVLDWADRMEVYGQSKVPDCAERLLWTPS